MQNCLSFSHSKEISPNVFFVVQVAKIFISRFANIFFRKYGLIACIENISNSESLRRALKIKNSYKNTCHVYEYYKISQNCKSCTKFAKAGQVYPEQKNFKFSALCIDQVGTIFRKKIVT